MSIRKVNFIEGEYYHIYNRGNSKQKIFHNDKDYSRFVELLYISNTDINFNLFDLKRNSHFNVFSIENKNKIVSLGAYCLIPNHFHLLISQTKEGGISKFTQKLSTAYSMYYNKKYKRTGSLFEGKFKSEHISKDRYLKYLFSYIHLNPVKILQRDWKERGIIDKKRIINFLNKYKYSSYLDYLETGKKRKEGIILTKELFPNYFSTNEKFQKEIFEWLSFKD
jgi:putative transposase